MLEETEPKRIALLLPNMGGGGAERVALASINNLVERGHQVDLVLVRAEGELLPLLPPEVRVINLNASRIIAALLPLARYLREGRPDALHAFMWPLTIIAILAHRLARSRARLMISDHTMVSRQARKPREMAMLRWSTRFFYPMADIRVACSARAADDLVALSGIARSRFEVIYSPISPPKSVATNPDVEQLWGDADQRIITVGSLKAVKNHVLLLRAFAKLRGYPNARLMILGEGQMRSKLEELADELGIVSRVLMPGFAVDPWPYFASADLFVLSSDNEGFPLVLAEAMHAGLKVVSTDCVSGPAEMLDNGRFGRLVPCGDVDSLAAAIDVALGAPADPKRMQARAIDMAGPAKIARYSELIVC